MKGSIHDPKGGSSKREALVMALLLLAATLIRLPNLLRPYVINMDAMDYIGSAVEIASVANSVGWEKLLLSIYPLIIAWLGGVLGDWNVAARSLSVVFGVLVVIPLYLFSREFIGRRLAWIPPLFYTISPAMVRYSLDVIRGPAFWFVSTFSLVLILKASSRNSNAVTHLFAGTFGLLAGAIRLEGMILLPMGIVFILVNGNKGAATFRQRATRALAFASPMLLALLILFGFQTSRLKVHSVTSLNTYKRQLVRAVMGSGGLDSEIKAHISALGEKKRRFFKVAWRNRWALGAIETVNHLVRTAHPLLFFLGVLGAVIGIRERRPYWGALGTLIVLWIALGYIKCMGSYFAISKRHLIMPAALSYIFAAVGVVSVRDFFLRRFSLDSSKIITSGLALIITLSTVPFCVRPVREEKLYRRYAGEWIRKEGWLRPVIVTNRPRVAFYAKGIHVSPDDFLSSSEIYADLIAMDVRSGEEELDLLMQKIRALGWKTQKIKVFTNQKENLEIYLICPPS
jgi:hypothetical protein